MAPVGKVLFEMVPSKRVLCYFKMVPCIESIIRRGAFLMVLETRKDGMMVDLKPALKASKIVGWMEPIVKVPFLNRRVLKNSRRAHVVMRVLVTQKVQHMKMLYLMVPIIRICPRMKVHKSTLSKMAVINMNGLITMKGSRMKVLKSTLFRMVLDSIVGHRMKVPKSTLFRMVLESIVGHHMKVPKSTLFRMVLDSIVGHHMKVPKSTLFRMVLDSIVDRYCKALISRKVG
jgi:hypothetical protein